eukprot:10169821-Lingulodinium_polyedra.AAC.1
MKQSGRSNAAKTSSFCTSSVMSSRGAREASPARSHPYTRSKTERVQGRNCWACEILPTRRAAATREGRQ